MPVKNSRVGSTQPFSGFEFFTKMLRFPDWHS